MTEQEALAEAIESAGSQKALGRICGRSQPNVWFWLHRARRIPAEHVLTVEAATGVSRHLLRPDIYPQSYRSKSGRTRAGDALVTQNETAR